MRPRLSCATPADARAPPLAAAPHHPSLFGRCTLSVSSTTSLPMGAIASAMTGEPVCWAPSPSVCRSDTRHCGRPKDNGISNAPPPRCPCEASAVCRLHRTLRGLSMTPHSGIEVWCAGYCLSASHICCCLYSDILRDAFHPVVVFMCILKRNRGVSVLR